MVAPLFQLHDQFQRQQIANAVGYGKTIEGGIWHSGVVPSSAGLLLLVTLKKRDFPSAHQYNDYFESDEVFCWASQPRDSDRQETGRKYVEHVERGLPVHLFVRPTKMLEKKGRAFTYFGPVAYERHVGPKPMRVWWRLQTPAVSTLWQEFEIPRKQGEEEPVAPAAARQLWPEEVAEVGEVATRGNYEVPDSWGRRKKRAGQAWFAEQVMRNFDGACCMCGLAIPELLDAAHIMPWNSSPKHRLDPANGLALCTLHHRAFDQGIVKIVEGKLAVDIARCGGDTSGPAAALVSLDGTWMRKPKSPVLCGAKPEPQG